MMDHMRTMRGANESDHFVRSEEYVAARGGDKEKIFAESEGSSPPIDRGGSPAIRSFQAAEAGRKPFRPAEAEPGHDVSLPVGRRDGHDCSPQVYPGGVAACISRTADRGGLHRLRLPAKSLDEWPTRVDLPVVARRLIAGEPPRSIGGVMGLSGAGRAVVSASAASSDGLMIRSFQAAETGEPVALSEERRAGHFLADRLSEATTRVRCRSAQEPFDWSPPIDRGGVAACISRTADQQITWVLPAISMVSSTQDTGRQTSNVGGDRTLIRHLAKDSAIYALPSFVGPLMTLGLAPFLTRALSHAAYGMLAVLMTAIALVAGVTQFGLNFACVRVCCYEYEAEADRRAAIATMTVLVGLLSGVVAVVLMVAAPVLSLLLFGSALFGNEVRLAALVVLMQNLSVPGLTWLRVEGRAVYFSVVSVVGVLVNVGATLVLVGVCSMGLVGALLAMGGGYACMGVCTLPVLVGRVGVGVRRDVGRNLLGFGVPLVANFVSTWVLQLSDRYVLGRLSSLGAVAGYAVAYMLGSALAMIITPFLLAWSPLMYAVAKRDDAGRVYQVVFRWFSLVVLFATYGLSLVGVTVLALFFPADDRSMGPVIPIVAVSVMFFGVYNFFTVGISIRRKTWYAVLLTTLAALVNVGMNVLVVPWYGAMGAAMSTLVAYALLAVVAYVVNQRVYWIPFEVGRFGVGLCVGVVLYTGSGVCMQGQGLGLSDAVGCCTLLVYGGCLVWLGVFGRNEGGVGRKG